MPSNTILVILQSKTVVAGGTISVNISLVKMIIEIILSQPF